MILLFYMQLGLFSLILFGLVQFSQLSGEQGIRYVFYETEFRTEWCKTNSTSVPCFLFARKFSRGAAMRLLSEGVISPFDITTFFNEPSWFLATMLYYIVDGRQGGNSYEQNGEHTWLRGSLLEVDTQLGVSSCCNTQQFWLYTKQCIALEHRFIPARVRRGKEKREAFFYVVMSDYSNFIEPLYIIHCMKYSTLSLTSIIR